MILQIFLQKYSKKTSGEVIFGNFQENGTFYRL